MSRLPPQTVDFARKSGELSIAMHPRVSVAVVSWSPVTGGSQSAVWDIGATGSGLKWSDMRTWYGGGSSDSPAFASACWWLNQSLRVCVADSTGLSLTSSTLEPASIATTVGTHSRLSTRLMLSLEQYHNYQGTPQALLQVAKATDTGETSARSSSSELVLQRFSLLTGTSSKLEDLPVWKNYQGAQLFPSQLLVNEAESAVCLTLQERGRSIATRGGPAVADTFPYVVMEIKRTANAPVESDNDDAGGASTGYRVTCGAQLEALDVCFARPVTGDRWLLLVLSSTGKSLGLQAQCDYVDTNNGVLLNQPVRRIFSTPLKLPVESPYAQTVGNRLLYVLAKASENEPDTLVLCGDDLSVPPTGGRWVSRPSEKIVDIMWNTSNVGSGVMTMQPMLSVVTTTRVVVLSANLAVIQTYDLRTTLRQPQSLLWVAHTLLFVSRDCQVRYVTPLATSEHREDSMLLCSLREPRGSASVSQTIDLLAVVGDRLCYAVSDSSTFEYRACTRLLSICEPLVMGFENPAPPALRAIVEREVLLFLGAGSAEAACPLSDALIERLYFGFGWKPTVLKLLSVVLGHNSAQSASSSTSASGASGSAGFSKAAHLSRQMLVSVFADAHKWRELLRVFVADDPGLDEYAFGSDNSVGGSSAKLPSRTGRLSQQFRQLATVMEAVGQSELAVRCFDLAGDDLALLGLLSKLGSRSADARAMLTALRKDWSTLNPPLAARVLDQPDDAQLASSVWRRHDLLSLLCVETLGQPERRSRLLTSVRPFDKMVVASVDIKAPELERADPAKVLPWKRLAPEDAKDWIGASASPHVSSDDPKPVNYALFSTASSSLLTAAAATGDGATSSDGAANASTAPTAPADMSSKTTIGPFLEEEDAVVAYWRFEEGATAKSSGEGGASPIDSFDTSKRENHLQLLGFGSVLQLIPSSAPVDRGEDAKLQEEFALHFPPTVEGEAAGAEEWGAKCSIRPGGTLDVGCAFDDDPYRRKLTVEAWVRDYTLAGQQQPTEEGDSETPSAVQTPRSSPIRRPLFVRKASDGRVVWELAISEDGRLELSFGGQQPVLRAESSVENAAAWHHVAFSSDVTSPSTATLRIFLNAKCVGAKEVAPVAMDTPSFLILGHQLRDFEMTEVRVWAAARSAEQLSDMKENYLTMAEAKRRMKIAIHQRNCQCDKCTARRGGAGGVKLSLASPFPSKPPASGSARDRRRPQAK